MKKNKKLSVISLKGRDKKFVMVECATIIRIQARDGYCTIHTTGGLFDRWNSLKNIVDWLNTNCDIKIVEISRGNAVNVQYIHSYHRNEGLYLKAPFGIGSLPLSEDGYNAVLAYSPSC